MRKTFLIGMAAMMISAASCKKSGDDAGATGGNGFRGIAEGQTSGSKTSLDPEEEGSDLRMVRWAIGDKIKVYSDTETAGVTLESDGSNTEVNFVDPSEAFIPNGTETYYAYYPGGNASGINGNVMDVTLPEVQTYVSNSFGDGANPMAAMNDEYTLHFKNLCGVLELNFKRKATDNVTVKTITVTSRNDGTTAALPLCGAGTVTFDGSYEDDHTLALTGSTSTSVTLDCGSGVALNTTETPFCIVLPGGTLGNGFDIEVEATDGTGDDFTWTKATHSMEGPVERGKITEMHAITITNPNPPTSK